MQSVACRHLRTGAEFGTGYKCRITDRYVQCLGLIRRCECAAQRAVHDRWCPTVPRHEWDPREQKP